MVVSFITMVLSHLFRVYEDTIHCLTPPQSPDSPQVESEVVARFDQATDLFSSRSQNFYQYLENPTITLVEPRKGIFG